MSEGSLDSSINNALKRWEKRVLEGIIERFPERREFFCTSSFPEVPRFLTPDDIAGVDYLSDIGFPGSFPFTRGVQPTMYRGRFWTMRQYAGFGTAEESNRRYRYLLSQGQTGLSVAFDLPTQIGYDSDDPMAEGEVGKVGVAIDSLADMEVLFRDIPLDRVSTSMTINATAPILLAMYIVLAEKNGIQPRVLSGTIQNDILKEYIARGTYIYPPGPSMRLITDVFAYCTEHVPRWNTISISGYHIREAGATAIQEIGFTLADGVAYCDAAVKAGLDVNMFGRRLSFFFNAHNNILEEIAKFRAARRLWARIMRDRFGADDPGAQRLRFHCQTAGSTLTAQQVDNNIVRVAYQALAAVLGGAQSLHTNSRDEALSLPTEESVRTALRTQQILAHETGIADTVDPLAGSYLIEKWTGTMEKEASKIIETIDEMGGMVRAIERGYVQKQIQDAAYKAQKRLESREDIVVGVNAYQVEETAPETLLKIDPEIEKEQIKRLKRMKNDRDNDAVETQLHQLRKTAANGSENLMPHILAAVRVYATIGEISRVFRDVFGEYEEKVTL